MSAVRTPCALDTELTRSFDAAVSEKAKAYAEANNISLSRLVVFMLCKVTDKRNPALMSSRSAIG